MADKVISFPKKKPHRDKKFLDSFKHRYCEICGAKPAEAHHLRTRGAGGGDLPSNLLALCRTCHSRAHSMGIKSFVELYKLPVKFDNGYPQRTDIR